jgi:hypothetical protein
MPGCGNVGRTVDGRQFFLTTPFRPQQPDDAGQEFVAMFLFDTDGEFLEARIEEFGARATMDRRRRHNRYEEILGELGAVSYGRIEVAPFAVERFGTTFGLLVSERESDDEPWHVELHPGNYMAFNEPWDSGDYDT